MNADDAIRFLAHEAKACRDRDAHEALCLVPPALLRVLGVRAMDDFEALEFMRQFHNELRALNESPLVEAHCEVCEFADTLPECRFSEHVMTGLQVSKGWCSKCNGERLFVRREAVPA